MKRIVAAVALMCVASVAWALDVVSTMTISDKEGVVFSQTSTFVGLTAAEEQALNKRGMKTLDYASQQQDKGGPFTITWKWDTIDGAKKTDTPIVETPGLKFSAVNQIMRMGVKWLSDTVSESEGHAKAGKKKPWGHKKQ
jgi:hypothetical protein